MANLIARLGLDSAEFKAGIAGAKASVGGFQGTIKSATTGMREMFDVALKPIAVVMAAVMAARKAFGALNEIVTATADNMRAIAGGNLEAGVASQGDVVSETARQYRNLTDEQSAYAASEANTLKAAEASAMALLKLQRAQALLADEKTGGKNREAITRDFADRETRLASGANQYGIGIDVRKTEDELAAKKARAEQLRQEAQDAEALAVKSLREASRLGQEKKEYIDSFAGDGGVGKKVATGVMSVFAGDVYQKELDKREEAQKKANAAAKQAVSMSKNLNDEAVKLEREYTYQSIALKELRTKAETESINTIADQLDKNASRLSALNAVKGQGVNPDSMARIGGFMGGEQKGLAVADKQLQVSKETLTIQKENKVLLQAMADFMARDRIGTGGDL